MTQQANQTSYQTTAKTLPPSLIKRVRGLVNIFHDGDFVSYGKLFTYTQLLIVYCIAYRAYARIILILPTQYGKSLAVSIGVLLRVSTHNEKWAIIAPTEDKARIIMDYIVEHVFDSQFFINKLEYSGTKEKLKQERSKTRITFRGGGEVRVYTANANNQQQVKKALMGFGSPNIVLDESSQIPDDLYSTVKRMLGGSEGTEGGTCLIEIGNPFFRNHFWRMWNSKRYVKVFVDYLMALKEGRYTNDYIEEMKDEAFFDVLYECKFPEQADAPAGYTPLISLAMLDNALIDQDLPLGHKENGDLIDTPILGIDPNHGGKNKTVMVVRYPLTGFAKVVLKRDYAEYKGKDITGEQLADAEKIIRDYEIDDYCTGVDAGNGGGLADALTGKGYLIQEIMFGGKPDDNVRYANKKAELYVGGLRKWIRKENGKLVRPSNDDKDNGFLELKEINYKETTTSKVLMESKDDLAKRSVESPDTGDALALTFMKI
jgi:hypothetical protein